MSPGDMKQILDRLPTIPSIPIVISEALNIIDNPKSNINQLSEVI